jgi:hypothetical protein
MSRGPASACSTGTTARGREAVASPIAANGHIYTVNESGTFTVLRAARSSRGSSEQAG